MILEAEGECPVCREPVSFEIDNPDAESQAAVCDNCGADLEISVPSSVQVDEGDIEAERSIEFECPVCHFTKNLDIDEESGKAEDESCENVSCDAMLAVFWSNWGRKAGDVEVEAVVTIEFVCPRKNCGGALSLDITEESSSEELPCEDCSHNVRVSWSDWGKNVKVR